VLAGSVGVPVSRHFCQGELKSIAFYGKAEKCHKDQKKAHCPLHPPAAEDGKKKGCCSDDFEVISIDDVEQSVDVVLPQLIAVAIEFPELNYEAPSLPTRLRKCGNLENYRPPPLVTDVPREWQVFRI
jgi:hypothetical protein